jgi:hypothetical protein
MGAPAKKKPADRGDTSPPLPGRLVLILGGCYLQRVRSRVPAVNLCVGGRQTSRSASARFAPHDLGVPGGQIPLLDRAAFCGCAWVAPDAAICHDLHTRDRQLWLTYRAIVDS